MSESELERLRETLRSGLEARADLVREMAAANNAAGLSEVLHRHGYAVSVDELERLRGEQSELSDQQLQGISGGGRIISGNPQPAREPDTARILAAIFTFGLSEIGKPTS